MDENNKENTNNKIRLYTDEYTILTLRYIEILRRKLRSRYSPAVLLALNEELVEVKKRIAEIDATWKKAA